MIEHETLLVTLVTLVSRIPVPPASATRGRGRPRTYPDRLFLQAWVMRSVRHRHTVHARLRVLAQPTVARHPVPGHRPVAGRFPARRPWERRLQAIPAPRPAPSGCLGRALVSLVQPGAGGGRAAAIDRPVWRARGGVWHPKDRAAGTVPHTSSDPAAHGTKSGWPGWVYGWQRPLVTTVAGVWIPLAADLTAATVADHVQALTWLSALAAAVRSGLGDQHDHDPAIDAACTQAGQTVVATPRGPSPHTADGVEVRRILHELRARE